MLYEVITESSAGGTVMTLLDFARGPAMQWALVIFVIGVTWRLA